MDKKRLMELAGLPITETHATQERIKDSHNTEVLKRKVSSLQAMIDYLGPMVAGEANTDKELVGIERAMRELSHELALYFGDEDK